MFGLHNFRVCTCSLLQLLPGPFSKQALNEVSCQSASNHCKHPAAFSTLFSALKSLISVSRSNVYAILVHDSLLLTNV